MGSGNMPMKLVVVRSFAQYAPGEIIIDAAEITGILSGENAAHVVSVASEPLPTTNSSHTNRG
jgi:hypothetical protein